MTEEGHEGGASDSDNDSVSLLEGLNAWVSRGAAEKERNESGAQAGNKEQEVERKTNRVKAPKGASSNRVQSASQSGNNRDLRGVYV